MSNFGPPPTGPGQPQPGMYPPGATPPPLPGQGYPPVTQPASSAWKYVLMGCAVVFLLVILVTGGTCYYAANHAQDLATMAVKAAKPFYLNLLTPDHTPEQRENFSHHLDLLFEGIAKEGFQKFGEKYGPAFQELQQISQDQKITVKESETWCSDLDDILAGRPPSEKPGEEKGEDVPL